MADTQSKPSPNVQNFGCRLNAYEAEVMENYIEEANLSNIRVFNSCAVTAEAVRQLRQSIRQHKRDFPEQKIIVTGCAAQIEADHFAQMQEVDFVLGNGEKMDRKIWDRLSKDLGTPISSNFNTPPSEMFALDNEEKVRVNDIMALKETGEHYIQAFNDRVRAFVQVQNGCDHRCTFCIIPYGRGNSRSVPMPQIIEQIKILLQGGVKEIVLTGVDITSYGSDLPGKPSLGSLVQKILKTIPDLERLRLSSLDMIELDEALEDALKSETRLLSHLHVSLQHGDNMILKRMKRRHNRDQSIEFCQRLKHARPDILFGADLIAGFPTETETMFENLISIVDECDLTFLHVFPFSPRPGTPAAKMPQLPKKTIKNRAKILREYGQKKLTHRIRQFDNTIGKLLVEGNGQGHLDNFLPVKNLDRFQSGDIVEIKLKASQTFDYLIPFESNE